MKVPKSITKDIAIALDNARRDASPLWLTAIATLLEQTAAKIRHLAATWINQPIPNTIHQPMSHRRKPSIDIGLAISGATLPPGKTRTRIEIAAFCDCSPQAIELIEQTAMRKLRHAIFYGRLQGRLTLNDLTTAAGDIRNQFAEHRSHAPGY